MTVQFGYDKKQVIQALRYHFLMRPEIKILLIFINVFAILSAILFAYKIIQPVSFLMFSVLWFILMLVIWRVLPSSIYKRSSTFKDHFIMHFNENAVTLETERGSKDWSWESFSKFIESPYFFHLYFDARSFFIIPKEAFVDIADLQKVRQWMKTKISK
ncbi:YcxB family protein [Pseudobacter ginsenosidimutans]|uniref:YcxB-like protein n=1 Tax=Pseudobacter ginsenosidimutans TaxID=661488 RepID=A0A4V2F0T7_9BACT|nr:YcxB family protein [Pseudobacter ginsenosidimutans]QEC41903.1 YcxB family protein [Pseudobacter ginsenosidimutans]RZS71271.1 YcxB-like protein [Pseudobacter ginsenosidimutans]